MNKLPNLEWQTNEERFLRKLHIETYHLYEFWNKKSKTYRKNFVRFNTPLVFLSGINGIIALVLSEYISQKYVSQINAIISISTGIMGSLNILLKINDKYANSLLTASKYHKLSIKISKELNLTKEKRLLSGKDFVNQCIDEYNSIFDNSDPMYNDIKDYNSVILLTDDKANIEIKQDRDRDRGRSFDSIRRWFKNSNKYTFNSKYSKSNKNYDNDNSITQSEPYITNTPSPIIIKNDSNQEFKKKISFDDTQNIVVNNDFRPTKIKEIEENETYSNE